MHAYMSKTTARQTCVAADFVVIVIVIIIIIIIIVSSVVTAERMRRTKEGATRVELVTSRSAVECSATELYPQIQSYGFLQNERLSFVLCTATSCNERHIDTLQ